MGDLHSYGSGRSTQRAKLRAAKKILEDLKKLPLPMDVTPYWRKPRMQPTDPTERPYFFYGKNPVSALYEILVIRRQAPPKFKFVLLNRERRVEVTLKVKDLQCKATALSKKEAKANAAERMLWMMGFKKLMQMHNPSLDPSEVRLFQCHVYREQNLYRLKILHDFKASLKAAATTDQSASEDSLETPSSSHLQDVASVPQTIMSGGLDNTVSSGSVTQDCNVK
ncbi:hypothetical protein WMY93_015497 [Mugilogobius chulae]|uniref:DRBM domain-containing protein n=1 Tax=Mugilogobius chulae TaxID=88201 RepID=A0AAW0P1M2_9GOBI